MKRSLPASLFFLIGVIILLSSCNKEEIPIDVKEELQGKWTIQEVKFQNSSIHSDSTSNYSNVTIEFKDDEITWNKNQQEDHFRGTFSAYTVKIEIVGEPDPFCDDTDEDTFNDCDCDITYETNRYMNAELTSIFSQNNKTLNWNDFEYDKNTITYSEFRNGGEYVFTLLKE